MYDVKKHSITLNVTTPNIIVTYSMSADGEYSATKPTFTDAGTYTVCYMLTQIERTYDINGGTVQAGRHHHPESRYHALCRLIHLGNAGHRR